MPEIGLGKGAGAGSFAAGFGKGLSQALVYNRERSDKKDLEAQRQREDLLGKLLPIYLQSGVDPADLEPILQQTFPKQFQQAKGGKKGESPFQKLAGFLGPLMGMHRGTTIESGWPGGPVVLQPGGHVGMDSPEQGGITGMLGRTPGPFGRQPEPQAQQPAGVIGGILGNQPVYAPTETPPDISQTPFAGAQPPPATPAHRTLMGVQIPSEEEQLQRQVQRIRAVKGAESDIDVDTKVRTARRIYEAGGAPSLEAAFDLVFPGRSAGSLAITPSSLFSDQLRRRQEELKRPLTADEVAKERQAWEALNDPTGAGVSFQRMTGVLEGESADKARTFFVNPKTTEITEQDGTPVKGTVTPINQGIAPVVIQTATGPQVVDRTTRTATPITQQGGGVVGPMPTQQMRNQQQQYAKARPVLNSISELSEKINTGQGALAKVTGAAAQAAARANLNDDVAEYEALISGFTPLVARALGHTGILTQQDVDSIKALFPKPGDSKTLRDRKIARINQLVGEIEDVSGGSVGANVNTGQQPPPKTDMPTGHKYVFDKATGQWK